MKIKLSIIISAASFLISLIIGIAIGNLLLNMLVKAIVFAVIFFAMTFGSLTFLEKKIPELFAISGSDLDVGENGEDLEPLDISSSDNNFGEDDEDLSVGSDTYVANDGLGPPRNSPYSGIREEFKDLGDHILVRDKKIKNEPKLIAEAIRTMLSRDEDAG